MKFIKTYESYTESNYHPTFQFIIKEYLVPMGISLSKWKKMQKKGMTAKKYHEENPDKKFKVVHGHKKGKVGDPLPGATNMTYNKASKMHTAVVMNEKVYYHGSDEDHKFSKSHGMLTQGSFFSEDPNVAKNYGKNIYKVNILTDNIFDPSGNKKHLDELFDYFGELEDPWDESIVTKDEFKSLSDTWSILEQPHVIDWIMGNYDGVKIIEGGSESNILLFNPQQDVEIIN